MHSTVEEVVMEVNVNDGNMEIQREEEIQTTVVNNAIERTQRRGGYIILQSYLHFIYN